MIHRAGGQGLHHFHREHAAARHHAFDIALRHQEQAVILEADHFGFDAGAVGQRYRAGAADRQLQAHRFHHQPCHARDPARHLHRLGDGQQFALQSRR
jgi:hypothetical protein